MRKQVKSRLVATASSGSSLRPTIVESLEPRTFLHSPTISSAIADNRGEVFMTVEASSRLEVDPATVNKNSVQMYGAGPDGILANADDVRVAASVRYTSSNGRILVRGAVTAGNGYRIKLVASRLQTFDDEPLDGEFNGASAQSGNGLSGGNYEFQVKNIKTTQPTVKMFTSAGQITLKLRADLVATTVNNFLRYANAGRYDGHFFHRNGRTETPSPIDIIQAGGYTNLVSGTHITQFSPIELQAGVINNDRGTISMARTNIEDSATSEFFFNVQTNSFLNPTGGVGGYAAFGTVTSGIDAVDAIFAANTVVRGSFNNVPQVASADVEVRRVSVVSKVAAL